jgi:hypothetical protein
MPGPDLRYALDDRYAAEAPPRIYLTGTQALVRMVLIQAEADRAAGLDTAGFVSGYRGSPLGAVDQEMWRAARRLEAAGVRFQPAVNEDLAATGGARHAEGGDRSGPHRAGRLRPLVRQGAGGGPIGRRPAARACLRRLPARGRAGGGRGTTMAASPPPCRTSRTWPCRLGECR